MEEGLGEVMESVLSKYPSVEVNGRTIVSQNYRDVLHIIPHIREKYTADFIIKFNATSSEKDCLRLDPISDEQCMGSLPYRRLVDALFNDYSEYYEEYWREGSRIFLRGDFNKNIREIMFHGLRLYDITVYGEQEVREYIIDPTSKRDFINSRCMQILEEISCPRCDSHSVYFEKEIPFTCNDCNLQVELSEFDFVYTDPISDIQIVFDWDVEIDDPEECEDE